ncbi:MAG TPA: xanthine dehydrogenase family protein subunit M [Conexibacter sp.]|nr:xanthine dehydrogenase family protein subunit M [Conexibacter sp.]
MKPAPFQYARPDSVEEAVRLLTSDEDAKAIAGGQSLVPMMNFRMARPSLLVDVTRIPDLAELRREGDELVVGAAVRQRVAERSPVVREACPLVPQALHWVGHPQIRARGTFGGSLAHADPGSELCALAVALDATLVAVGPEGRREIPASEFFFAPYMTSLEEGELLVQARLPTLDGARSAFHEIARRAGDFAVAGAAVAVWGEPGGAVGEARLAGLGVGGTVLRLHAAEEALRGNALDDATIAAAGDAAAAECDPSSDLHGDADTRRAALKATVEGALREVAA